MPRKFIDLSVSLQEGIKSDPDFMLPKINYHHHFHRHILILHLYHMEYLN